MKTIAVTHNQIGYISKLVECRLHALNLFLEPDLKSGFTSEEVFAFQSEKVELQNVLVQLTEG